MGDGGQVVKMSFQMQASERHSVSALTENKSKDPGLGTNLRPFARLISQSRMGLNQGEL